ncbi:MAG: hypothetical protein GF375_03235, partial [Candidatus Omnitrophica bacterium]|nr:hypothetical protein [Candidatus Omnitrophota bacterium]MBD3269097.1 hypothetical protein [Candidatus Omnitrophota bacterium]
MSEKALFIKEIKELSLWEKGYSRIYFGDEFCSHLLPGLKDLKELEEFVSSRNLKFTLVTPFLEEYALQGFESLLQNIPEGLRGCEVVLNDWATLKMCRKFGFKPVLGRLLTRQKQDPRLYGLKKYFNREEVDYICQPALNRDFLKFLALRGIGRIELNPVLQGIKIEQDLEDFSLSLYYPYGYITTSNDCFFAKEEKKCFNNCVGAFCLGAPSFPVRVFLKGNTLFFRNGSRPEDIISGNFDVRVIVQPDSWFY